jgi:hypothetical protein
MKKYTKKSIIAILLFSIFFSGNVFCQTKKQTQKKTTKKIKASERSKKSTKKRSTKKKKKKKGKKATPSSIANMKKLITYIKSKGIRSVISIIGITGTQLEYVIKFRKHTIPIKDIESANFITDYDPYKIKVLERKKEYSTAAAEIINKLAPALKYIKLPENNLVDPLFDAAYLYMRAASVYDDKKSKDFDKDKAQAEYAKAYRVFKKIAQAKWYYGAKLAELNTIFCNIRMNKLDIAAKQFAKIEEPLFGDADFGLYWLIDAQLKFHNNQLSQALDSVVKSIVFDTKDIHTFPEGLLLSAYCYEDMLDNYRARDTFYEVAKLFNGTPEGEIAFSSIQFIRNKKLTEQAEAVGLEKIFFDNIEDVNKKIDDHIVVILEKKKIEEEKRKEREERLKKTKENNKK